MKERIGQAVKGQLIDIYPPEAVTTAGEEVDPRDVGLGEGATRRIWGTVESLYATRLYPAIALCLRHKGQVIVNRAIGHARGNGAGDEMDAPKVLATPDSLFNLFSASKVMTAMLIHHLDDQGLVHLDDPVAAFIPEFAQHGKGGITLRHVLSHRAGIPSIPGENVDLDLLTDKVEIIRRLSEGRASSVAGRRLAYHAVTGGFILEEVIRRVTGKGVRQLLAEVVREPMGLEHLSYGVDEADLGKVAIDSFTGPSPPEPFAWLMRRAMGVGVEEVVKIATDPRFLTGVVPAGNVIGTADEACKFFEMLLRGGTYDGKQIFDRRTVRRATAEQSYHEVDTTLFLPVRYGMGFMLGSDVLSFYGFRSPLAFGHLGFTNVLAYADPERDLSCCLMTTGKPFVHLHLLKWLNIMQVISRVIPRRPLAQAFP